MYGINEYIRTSIAARVNVWPFSASQVWSEAWNMRTRIIVMIVHSSCVLCYTLIWWAIQVLASKWPVCWLKIRWFVYLFSTFHKISTYSLPCVSFCRVLRRSPSSTARFLPYYFHSFSQDQHYYSLLQILLCLTKSPSLSHPLSILADALQQREKNM